MSSNTGKTDKFVSIHYKIIANVMGLMGSIFLLLLIVITALNISNSNKNLESSEGFVRSSLDARGRILVRNNSIALKGLAADNAFVSIQELVSATVASDDDIVRGIYMDSLRMPWVNASSANPNKNGSPESMAILSDSIDLWANSITSDTALTKVFKSTLYDESGNDLIEFAAPVIDTYGNILGHIRYSFSTTSMLNNLEMVRADAISARTIMILVFVSIMILAIIITYFLVERLTNKITKPIDSLVVSAKRISQGDYSVEVVAESNDEIGKLSHNFEEMRKTVEKYTNHLQDLIDEKMQQVKDILNNIDQGLFTINFDGTVNDEYSARANDILKVGDISNYDVYELLRLESGTKKSFNTWVDLVRKKHGKQRWRKLEKLAPVHEMEFRGPGSSDSEQLDYVSVSYQKIYNRDGDLSKLMILTVDETEKRRKEQAMKDERLRHENEMKTILGIANTPEAELISFLEDTETRISEINKKINEHIEGVINQRQRHPSETDTYDVTPECIDALYRNIHTIKGNGGSYGFDLLSQLAHQAEDALEELKAPLNSRRGDNLKVIEKNITEISEVVSNIRSKLSLIYGDDNAVFVRVSEENIAYIQRLTDSISSSYGDDELVCEMRDVAMKLSWKPLKEIARKYRKIVATSSNKLNKEIDFTISNEATLYPPEIFDGLDEVMMHVLRNSVDHGIETNDERAELEKGTGTILLSVEWGKNQRVVSVTDDGKGLDTEMICRKATKKGLLAESDINTMSEQEKINIIFTPGFSTASSVTEISGRGVGLDVVKTKIEELDGILEVNSTVNKGTTFTITMPQ